MHERSALLLNLPQARKALYHAALCQRIGEGFGAFQAWADGAGIPSRSISSISNTAGVLVSPKETMVAFQGTDDIADILMDMECSLISTPFGRVHEGFQFIWSLYEPQFLSVLKNIDPKKERPLSVTGHSLGGALASLAASCAARKGYLVKDSYLFGCPRVGDSEWVANTLRSGAHLIRVINDQDIVTRIPCWGGYEHLPVAFYLDGKGRGSEARPFSPKSLLWDSWSWIFPDLRNDHDLTEHSRKLELYAAGLST